MQFTVHRFHFHGVQSTFSQSQIGYAHKQKIVGACSYFNCIKHEISELSIIVIEEITSWGDTAHIDRLLLTREAYWTSQLCTLSPHGLNKRRKFRSKNRVRYNT